MGAISIRAIAPQGGKDTAEAERAFERLVGWMASKRARALPLHEVERREEEQIREVARLLLQEHIDARGQGAVGHGVKRATGELLTEHRLRERGYVSIFGKVTDSPGGRRGRGRPLTDAPGRAVKLAPALVFVRAAEAGDPAGRAGAVRGGARDARGVERGEHAQADGRGAGGRGRARRRAVLRPQNPGSRHTDERGPGLHGGWERRSAPPGDAPGAATAGPEGAAAGGEEDGDGGRRLHDRPLPAVPARARAGGAPGAARRAGGFPPTPS